MIIPEQNFILKNGTTIILRSPLPEEAELVLHFFKLFFKESYRYMMLPASHWDEFPLEQEVKILSTFKDTPNQFMLTAYHEGKIVGFLSLFPMQGHFHKQNARFALGTLQAFKGQGLGKKLIQIAESYAKSLDFHRIEFGVRTFNTNAIALYEQLGFEKAGHLKEVAFIDGQYYDEFIYQKIIDRKNS